MTTKNKFIRRKQSLLELVEYLQNDSQACKIHRISRRYFYDTRKSYEDQGLEGLKEKTRKKPRVKIRVAPEVEEALLKMACAYPA